VRAAHRRPLEQAELSDVELAGEELVLERVSPLDELLGQPGPERVRVVRDRRVADDRAAREEPRRALRELGRRGRRGSGAPP